MAGSSPVGPNGARLRLVGSETRCMHGYPPEQTPRLNQGDRARGTVVHVHVYGLADATPDPTLSLAPA